MAVVTGYDIGKRLCEALGLDPNGVIGLDIRVRPDEVVTVNVIRMAEVDQMEITYGVLTEYQLVEKPESHGLEQNQQA